MASNNPKYHGRDATIHVLVFVLVIPIVKITLIRVISVVASEIIHPWVINVELIGFLFSE
jgi:hypothetical protein